MKVDWSTFWPRIVEATGETLIMVIATLIFGSIIGICDRPSIVCDKRK